MKKYHVFVIYGDGQGTKLIGSYETEGEAKAQGLKSGGVRYEAYETLGDGSIRFLIGQYCSSAQPHPGKEVFDLLPQGIKSVFSNNNIDTLEKFQSFVDDKLKDHPALMYGKKLLLLRPYFMRMRNFGMARMTYIEHHLLPHCIK